jgi:hypothetical protein
VWECVLSLRALNTFSTTLSSFLLPSACILSWTLSSHSKSADTSIPSFVFSTEKEKTLTGTPDTVHLMDPTQPADVSSKLKHLFDCPHVGVVAESKRDFQTRSPWKHSLHLFHVSVQQTIPASSIHSFSQTQVLARPSSAPVEDFEGPKWQRRYFWICDSGLGYGHHLAGHVESLYTESCKLRGKEPTD